MTEFHYFSPTTPGHASWDETLTTIPFEGRPGFVDCAELGMVGMGAVYIDDPEANVGHSGTPILGLKQFYVTETACEAGDERLWTGYIADRTYSRSGAGVLFPVGAGRVVDVTLLDVNSLLSFRVFQPESLDATSSFNRPAETAGERVTALLAVDFLSTTLYDLGLVDTADTTAMPANDYTRQRPVDVLADCAQQSGRNFFAYYSEADNKLGLFYNLNDANVYPAAASISNVAADIGTAVFMPEMDWSLHVDPSRVWSGVLGSYRGGSVYDNDLDTSYVHGYRDMVVDMPNIAGSAFAAARVTRYLAENATEDERPSGTLRVPAADVNKIKAGQYLTLTMTHFPGYETGKTCRVLRRDVSQSATADQWYNVRLELTPMTPSPHVLIAFAAAGPVGMPDDQSDHPWTLGGYVAGIGDPYQTGGCCAGPPENQQIGWWYRDIVPGESATVLHFGNNYTNGAWVFEVAGVTLDGIAATADLGGTHATPYTHTVNVAATAESVLFAAIGWAKVDYDGGWRTPSAWVVTTAGTELVNASANNDGSEDDVPWVQVAYAEGTGTLQTAAAFTDRSGSNAYSAICDGVATLLLRKQGSFSIVQSKFGAMSVSNTVVTLDTPPEPF